MNILEQLKISRWFRRKQRAKPIVLTDPSTIVAFDSPPLAGSHVAIVYRAEGFLPGYGVDDTPPSLSVYIDGKKKSVSQNENGSWQVKA